MAPRAGRAHFGELEGVSLVGRKSSTGGVRPLGKNRILLYFRFQLQQCRPSLDLAPTPPNLAYAKRLVNDIEERIRNGRFDLAKEFPDYKGLNRFGVAAPAAKTFDEYSKLLIAAKGKLSASTVHGYEKILDTNWRHWFEDRQIGSILRSEVMVKMGEASFGRKTYNNVLDVGRQVFAMALGDGMIKENPALAVAYLKLQDPEPDPFTQEEIELILPGLEQRWGAAVRDYFEFAFFSGLRPSEQIELWWPKDIDLVARTAKIQRAKVRSTVKDTKTYYNRLLELNNRAYGVLLRQKERTYLAGQQVWLNPFTGDPYSDEHRQGEYFRPVLKRLGIRHRPAKNTRHTYATILLMSGTKPAWAASQLGHSVQVFLKIYSKWIPGGDRGAELAKVEAFTNAGSIPKGATEPKSGT